MILDIFAYIGIITVIVLVILGIMFIVEGRK
jgi:hypothetical protein